MKPSLECTFRFLSNQNRALVEATSQCLAWKHWAMGSSVSIQSSVLLRVVVRKIVYVSLRWNQGNGILSWLNDRFWRKEKWTTLNRQGIISWIFKTRPQKKKKNYAIKKSIILKRVTNNFPLFIFRRQLSNLIIHFSYPFQKKNVIEQNEPEKYIYIYIYIYIYRVDISLYKVKLFVEHPLFFFSDVQTVYSLPHNIAFYIYGASTKLSTRFTLDTMRKKFSLQIFTIVWKDFWRRKKRILCFILARKSPIFSNFYFFDNKRQSRNSKFVCFSQFKDFQGEKRIESV